MLPGGCQLFTPMVFLPDSILTTIQLGVSVPSAGLLVSIYALGVAIGAPLLTALTGRIPRKVLLIGLMVLFTLGNLLAWQSPGYESLVVARLLTGLAHGVFFSIGSTIATSLVPKEKAASAIAIMFGGLTVALVTGVPLGTFIGQHFGWRETFLAVSLIGVVAIIASAILVPNNIPNKASASIKQQLQVLTHPRLLLIYGIRIWRFLYHVYFPGPRYAIVGGVFGCCGKLDFAGIRNICCDW